ncbi:hypothetical protein VB713_26005 [Anabaena cylindrica UHCC 0172]|nr:hypothetical protein [Anabaena cylindrica]MEA5554392.1 hypothetical protein [Anabaena cylindrica UHCC 0172]
MNEQELEKQKAEQLALKAIKIYLQEGESINFRIAVEAVAVTLRIV